MLTIQKSVLEILAIAALGNMVLAAPEAEFDGRRNLALGKSYTFGYAPNWGTITDAGDKIQLTDGSYGKNGAIWENTEAVGWWVKLYKSPYITVDLGQDQPISGAAYRGGGNSSGTMLPRLVAVNVSTDGVEFYSAGVLEGARTLPDDNFCKEQMPGALYNSKLKTHGRYVRFIPLGLPANCTALDELEVYAGEDSFLKLPYSGNVLKDDQTAVTPELMTEAGILHRMRRTDILLQNELASGRVPENVKYAFEARRKALREELLSYHFQGDIRMYQAVMPVSPLNAKQFDLLADLRRAEGFSPVSVWSNYRYDAMPHDILPSKESPAIALRLAGNDQRAGVFNVTNYSGNELSFTFRLIGDAAACAKVCLVEDVDDSTMFGNCLQPLLELTSLDGTYRAAVPNGMTRQIWIDFSSSALKPGVTTGTILVSTPDGLTEIPVSLQVSNKSLPQSPWFNCHLWEFIGQRHWYRITDANADDAYRLLKEHLITTSVISVECLALPDKSMLDPQGHILKPLDFTLLDKHLSCYPDARYYYFFNGGNMIPAPFPPGSPEFNTCISEWAVKLEEHIKSLGQDPSRFKINFLDEPNTPAKIKNLLAWISPFQKGCKTIKVVCNPNRPFEGNDLEREMLKTADILPLPRRLLENPQAMDFVFANKRPEVPLECGGASTPRNPGPKYYLALPLLTYRPEITGMGLFTFSRSNCPNMLNEYVDDRDGSYTPCVLTPDHVYPTKMMRSITEMIRNMDTFHMMKDQKLAAKLAQEAGRACDTADQDGRSSILALEAIRAQVLDILEKE